MSVVDTISSLLYRKTLFQNGLVLTEISFIVMRSSPPRLKEEIKTSEHKVNSLTVDLRRKDDDSSDLREKLCDSKKQIQQVQKEVRICSA